MKWVTNSLTRWEFVSEMLRSCLVVAFQHLNACKVSVSPLQTPKAAKSTANFTPFAMISFSAQQDCDRNSKHAKVSLNTNSIRHSHPNPVHHVRGPTYSSTILRCRVEHEANLDNFLRQPTQGYLHDPPPSPRTVHVENTTGYFFYDPHDIFFADKHT